MASAKILYWATLGVLAVTFVWSHAGRSVMNRASVLADQVYAKSSQYAAIAELAFGNTQSGLGHMQAATARMAAQQARLQAEQARIKAELIREQANQLFIANQDWQENNLVRVNRAMQKVTNDRVLVCPRTNIHVGMPDLQMPEVTEDKDPI